MNNVGDIFPKVLQEGKIEDLGGLGLETKEGWVYPKYMAEACPGLPDWSALILEQLDQGIHHGTHARQPSSDGSVSDQRMPALPGRHARPSIRTRVKLHRFRRCEMACRLRLGGAEAVSFLRL